MRKSNGGRKNRPYQKVRYTNKLISSPQKLNMLLPIIFQLEPVNLVKGTGGIPPEIAHPSDVIELAETRSWPAGTENNSFYELVSQPVYNDSFYFSVLTSTEKAPKDTADYPDVWNWIDLSYTFTVPKQVKDLEQIIIYEKYKYHGNWMNSYLTYVEVSSKPTATNTLKNEKFQEKIKNSEFILNKKKYEQKNPPVSLSSIKERLCFHCIGPEWEKWDDGSYYSIIWRDMPVTTTWRVYKVSNLKQKFVEKGFNLSDTMKYVGIYNDGRTDYDRNWDGQAQNLHVKLMGFADYNVALPSIKSPSLINPNEEYVPEVVVWNNGRKNLSNIKVQCRILRNQEIIYNKTKNIYSLASDDSVTLSFPSTSLEQGNYKLEFIAGGVHARFNGQTFIDESEDDDYKYINLNVVGINEERGGGRFIKVGGIQTGQIRFWFTSESMKYTLKIFDICGRVIYTRDGDTCERHLDCGLPSGIYFWEVKTRRGVERGKVILLE